MVNVQAMNDDIIHVLNGKARPVSDLNGSSPAVDGLVARYDKLILENDGHICGEVNPKRNELNHSITQRSGSWIFGIVAWVRDDVEVPFHAAYSLAAEAYSAVGKPFPILRPAGIGSPAIVNAIEGAAIIAKQLSAEFEGDVGTEASNFG